MSILEAENDNYTYYICELSKAMSWTLLKILSFLSLEFVLLLLLLMEYNDVSTLFNNN